MSDPINLNVTVTVKPAPLSRGEKLLRWVSFGITVVIILFGPSK
jgi:hypothetical protein